MDKKKKLSREDIIAASLGAIGGGIGLAGGAIGVQGGHQRYDKKRYTGDVLSSVASGAATLGSTGAIFGGVGAGIGFGMGALGGLAMGIAGASKAREEQALANRGFDISQDHNKAILESNRERLSKINTGAHTIPMFEAGTGRFFSNSQAGEHNAMVSPEEAIVSPDGNIDIVPGKYSKKSVDTVKASLEDGSAVVPKNEKFRLPHGKSTTADIFKRIKKIEEKSKKTMYGKRFAVTSIDLRTARKNIENMGREKDKVLNYANLVREGEELSKVKGLNIPKYDFGKDLERKVSKGLAYGAAGAGALSQYLQAASVERVSPTYMQYTPNKYTSDIGAQMDDARRRSNISRFNQSVYGRNTGVSQPMAAANRYNEERSIRGALRDDALRRIALENANIGQYMGVQATNIKATEEAKRIDSMNRAAGRTIQSSVLPNLAGILNPRMYTSGNYSQTDLQRMLRDLLGDKYLTLDTRESPLVYEVEEPIPTGAVSSKRKKKKSSSAYSASDINAAMNAYSASLSSSSIR